MSPAVLRRAAWLLMVLLVVSPSLGLSPPVPQLQTEPDPPGCDLGRLEQGQIAVWRFQIQNGGGGRLEWTARSDEGWLLLEPQSGSLEPEGAALVGVTVDTAGLAPGAHRGRIAIASNGGSSVGLITFKVIPPGGLAQAPWPAFHRDPQRTGRSTFPGPGEPEQRWLFETSGPIWSSPVIGAEGTIYLTSLDGWLYALTPEGREKWSLQLGGIIEASPALGREGTIYVGNSRRLYAISPQGEVLWTVELGRLTTSSPIIGGDGTVYVGGERLFAINPDGSTKWTFETAGYIDDSAPALGADGAIYAGFSNAAWGRTSELIAINAGGTERWEFHVPGTIPSSPAVRADGTVYFLSKAKPGGNLEDNRLYAVGRSGKPRWSHYITIFPHTAFLSSPAVGEAGTVYVGSDDYALYAIDSQGKELWHFTTGGPIHSSPAIDGRGTVYVGSDDGNLYAINGDGSLNWRFPTGGAILSSPAIGADGTIYVGSNDHHLYAIGSSPGRAIFHFSSLAVTPTDVAPGQELRAQAEVANRGDAAGTVRAELIIDNLVRDRRGVSLDPGQTQLVSFSFSFTAAELGKHQVTIDGLPPVEIVVSED